MVNCDFCDENFDSERDLHLHWGEEHEDELNSHQKDKVKKVEREKEKEKQEKMAERKRIAGYGLAGIAGLAVVAFVVSQVGLGGGGNASIDTTGQPYLGNSNASVTVVEFGDYRCPVCKQFHEQVYPQLKNEYIDTDRIKFVFISYSFLDEGFPGDSSTTASVASECVYRQDKDQFWDFHNALYKNQGPESQDWATEDFLMDLARNKTEGLNYEDLDACIENRETLDQVEKEKQIGQSAQVRGTPAIFVNGKYMDSWRYSNLKSEIERQLSQ